MSEENKFKDSLNQFFEGYEAPLPKDGWERLNTSLSAAHKAKIARRNWYIGTAAAVAAMLIGAILLIYSPDQITESPALTKIDQKEVLNTIDSTTDKTKEYKSDKLTTKVAPDQLAISAKYKVKSQTESLLVSNIRQSETVELSKNITNSNARKHQIPSKAKLNAEDNGMEQDVILSQEEIDKLIAEFANAGKINIFDVDDYDKDNSPIMLAVNVAGAMRGSQSVTNSPATLRSSSTDIEEEGKTFVGLGKHDLSLKGDSPPIITNNIANNKAKLHHSQPVSVGFMVSKNIVDRLSVETGLVYTYLYSSTRNKSQQFMRDEKQHLHYLGLPLNLNYNFISLGNFDLYASIGGKIEKDIYGKYHINSIAESEQSYAEMQESESINLKNPQFSVTGGFGVSYPLYKGLNIYGKLGGAYYFDAKNHQYKTIYSDKQFIIDLNVGLRFDF